MTEGRRVVVAGLGAMGSAAADHLARAGFEVVGLDPRDPPHSEGSHGGRTRIIRKAYFEHPTYVPWVRRAYQLWAQLQEDADRELFVRTGGLHVSTPEGRQKTDAQYAVQAHGLTADELDDRELVDRFPGFAHREDLEAIYSPHSGFLWAREAIDAQLARARNHGATLSTGEGLQAWGSTAEGVRVQTARGTIEADHLVLAVGAWLPEIAPDLPVTFTVERQVQFRFPARRHADRFTPETFPIFAFDGPDGQVFYGIPVPDRGVKIAAHHGGQTTTADTVDRIVRDADEAKVRRFVRSILPDLDGAPAHAEVCLYTNTPDHHFLLDRHPTHEDVVVASPCSGHGFKFAPAIGEGIKDLLVADETRQPRYLFRMGRFGASRS
jgi:sarcosine oxidase